MHDLLPTKYSLTGLTATVSQTYNNIVADGGWILSDKNNSAGNNAKDSTEAKFLTLSAQTEALTKENIYNNATGTWTDYGPNEVSWRFTNKEGKKTMTRNNRKYNWGTKDCHNKPMWYGCPNYRSKEKFKKFKEVERATKKDTDGLSADFKVALAVVCSDEDYKYLKAQFLSKNRTRGRLEYTIIC